MGSLISRFRKKPTTEEQLKKIEDALKKIEDYKRSTERKHKKLVASIIIYSAALYILACVIVFVWYLPESWLIRLGLLIALVLIPIIVYFLKRLISRYFDSRMIKANEEFADLQRKKKEIIDTVMETETFNKAKDILSKYAPEKLDKKQPELSGPLVMRSSPNLSTELRKRNTAQVMPKPGGIPPTRIRSEPTSALAVVPRRDLSPLAPGRLGGIAPTQHLPRPVLSRERGITDKLIDFMIGDGPNNRFALICSNCKEHNGMALKEEFPYLAFKCCYCSHYNPARSKRPVPPKLPDIKGLWVPPPCDSQSIPALIAPNQESLPVLSKVKVASKKASDKDAAPSDEGAASSEDNAGGLAEDVAASEDPATEAASTNLENNIDQEAGTEDVHEEKSDDYFQNLDHENNVGLDVDAGTKDVYEEKLDRDFQNLGFSESDLEFLMKVNTKPEEEGPEEKKEGPIDKET